MIRLISVHLLVLTVCLVKSQNSSSSFESSCEFIDENNFMQNRNLTLDCCSFSVRIFYREWSRGRRSLSTFLNNLKSWQCPQFDEECKRQTFAYNDFTKFVYLKFCQPFKLEKKCFNNLQTVHQKEAVNNSSLEWKNLIRINYSKLNANNLLDPCVQVGMLESAQKQKRVFYEVIEAFVPFCSFVWCGFDETILKSKEISVWTCMIPE